MVANQKSEVIEDSKETFEQWLSRIAEIKKWNANGEGAEPELIDMYVSRIDGGYLCFSNLTEDLRWMYNAGITEQIQKKRPDGNVCCIGFNPTEQKWYGWSHRAYYGFGVGDDAVEAFPEKVSGGVPPKKAATLEDAKQMAIDFAESVD